MLGTERQVLILVALPGVDPDHVEAIIDGADLVIGGARVLPAELRTAVIHRLELPQGRFPRGAFPCRPAATATCAGRRCMAAS